MKRTKAWTAVRWGEFAALVGAATLAIVESIEKGNPGLAPSAVAGLALLSKFLRALLTMVGQRASTLSAWSWAVAIVLALVTAVAPGAMVVVKSLSQEVEHVEASPDVGGTDAYPDATLWDDGGSDSFSADVAVGVSE
ncbi:MAG: hypothetical protein QXS54_11550 [Candidatus Methanomethylicaceae archaeon]